jgi:hypothetical protein
MPLMQAGPMPQPFEQTQMADTNCVDAQLSGWFIAI